MRLRVLLVAAIVETDTIMRGLSRGGGIMMAMPNYHVLGKPYMRTFGTFPSLRVARNPLVTLFIFVFVIYLGYKAAQAILANDLSTLIYAGTFLVGGGGCIAVLNDWRRGVYPLVAWILFEDFSESV